MSSSIDVNIFPGIAEIPHFNPDLDIDDVPTCVASFRQTLREADGILICTPEYAVGVPGTLKNAIDWTESSMEFGQKPVALITASSSGHKAHLSLLETMKVIKADLPEASALLISFVKTKVKEDKIIDPVTLEQVIMVIQSLLDRIENHASVSKD